MKRTVLSLLVFLAAGLVTLASPALAQEAAQIPQPPLKGYYTYGKLRGVSTDEAMRGAAAATTVPMWGYTITSSRDSNTYSGVMVGRSPFFHGARTTTIPVVIIPVKFTMTDHDVGAQVFDPTATDATCSPHGSAVTVFQNSPILNAVNFTMPFSGGINVGSGQYVDEFQRANFWSSVSPTGNRFHTALSRCRNAAGASCHGADRAREGIPRERFRRRVLRIVGRTGWLMVGSRDFHRRQRRRGSNLDQLVDDCGKNLSDPVPNLSFLQRDHEYDRRVGVR